MKHSRLIGDPIELLIAETKAEAAADRRREAVNPLAYRFCGWVAAATAVYMVAQLARTAARLWGWSL